MSYRDPAAAAAVKNDARHAQLGSICKLDRAIFKSGGVFFSSLKG